MVRLPRQLLLLRRLRGGAKSATALFTHSRAAHSPASEPEAAPVRVAPACEMRDALALLIRLTLLLAACGLFIGLVLIADPAVRRLALAAPAPLKDIARATTDLVRPAYVLWIAGLILMVLGYRFRVEAAQRLSALHQHLIGAVGFVFGAVALSNIAVNLLKLAAGRARPKLIDTHGPAHVAPFSGASGFDSFPSGHAATAFALATALSLMLPQTRAIAFGLAALIAAARLVLDKHYFTDVAAGAAIGVIVTLWAARWMEARSIVFARNGRGLRRVRGARLVRHAWRRSCAELARLRQIGR